MIIKRLERYWNYTMDGLIKGFLYFYPHPRGTFDHTKLLIANDDTILPQVEITVSKNIVFDFIRFLCVH